MMKYNKIFNLLDGRENISINQDDCDYFVYETIENLRDKSSRESIKKRIINEYENFKSSNTAESKYKFSFSMDYTDSDTLESLRKKTFWSGWNSMSYERYINDIADHYFFIISEGKKLSGEKTELHIIHFDRAKLDVFLQKKEVAANGVYYFYFSKERDLNIEKILERDFSSLEGVWKNGKNEEIVIEGSTITNRNHKLTIPNKNDDVHFPFLYVSGVFVGGYAMGLLKSGDKLPLYSDVSNYMRPRLVLGQALVQYGEDDYFYRS